MEDKIAAFIGLIHGGAMLPGAFYLTCFVSKWLTNQRGNKKTHGIILVLILFGCICAGYMASDLALNLISVNPEHRKSLGRIWIKWSYMSLLGFLFLQAMLNPRNILKRSIDKVINKVRRIHKSRES